MEGVAGVDYFFLECMPSIQNKFLTSIMIFLSTINNKGVIWILLSLGLLLNTKTKRDAIVLVSALIVVTILGEGIIKHLVMRERPFVTWDLPLLIHAPKGYSFPSGHTASSMAVVGIFLLRIKKHSFFITLLALGISFSRLYLQVHYLTDVLAGILLGFVTAYGVDKFFKEIWKE